MEPKSNRGGARPGSGRKPIKNKVKPFRIYLLDGQKEKLIAKAGKVGATPGGFVALMLKL